MTLPLRTLRAYRVLLGMTQSDMAKRIGISLSNYCYKEKGKMEFTIKEMFKILDIIRVEYPAVSMEALFSCPLIHQNDELGDQNDLRSDV